MIAVLLLCSSIGRAQNSTPEANFGTIRVPKGFVVELAADADKTTYSMFANFDERGRLFIAQSSGKNIKGAAMAENPECRILLLEDRDGDGFFETSKVFADKVGIPMGVLWHDGAVYVASPPDLLRLEDTDGDGVADKRTVILTGWNVRGTASLHGPFVGPDGWLYLTDGRHGFDIQTKEGTQLKGLAARVWRLRPDGTQLQSFCGGGFDNPVEIIFRPSGEMIGTMTYFTDPQNGQRDSLMHWVEGGVYRKWFSCVSEFKLTGELMPPMTKFARIAPAGLMQYRGAVFGAEYKGNLFSAQFNPHRVQRHVLFREGSTFRTEDEDFMTSTDPDFHPCDVLEDADGSLLVVDTGGWYVDQCPLSRVSRPEKRGAIYRVKKVGTTKMDPRGLKLDLEKKSPGELAKYLEDSRFAVRDRSRELLVKRGEAAVSALAKVRVSSSSSEVRCAAVWGLFRIGTAAAQEGIRTALTDTNLEVRVAALSAVGFVRDTNALKVVKVLMFENEPAVRREAATVLGKIGDGEAGNHLLNASRTVKDRFEDHAIIYALIQLKNSSQLLGALKSSDAKIRRTALIALDQMDNSPLQRKHLSPVLQDKDKELWRAALWVISHHPDWADEVIGVLRQRLGAQEFPSDEMEIVRDAMVSFCHNGDLQNMVADLLGDNSIPAARKLFLLDVIDRSSLAQLPTRWIQHLGELLETSDDNVRLRVISLVRSRSIGALDEKLKAIASGDKQPVVLRIASLGALVVRQANLTEQDFVLLVDQFGSETDAAQRASAANVLGKAKWNEEQLLRLANGPMARADALTLPALTGAFQTATNENVGRALVAALSQSNVGSEVFGGGKLEKLLQPFPESVRAAAKPLFRKIEEQQVVRMGRLKELEPALKGGDVGRGRRIFFGPKAACSSCHPIGTEGATIGPDLTSIGAIRSGPDILEAIVFPSASFVPGYEPFRVETAEDLYTGILASQTADAVVLKTAGGEMRIARGNIRTMAPGTISIMPEGLDAALSREELIDLLAFLQAQNGNEFLEPTRR